MAVPALWRDSRAGYEACTGCQLCVLPCPVWRATKDMAMTLAGRAKALQYGAAPADLSASLDACVLCGACEVVCPEEIDTVGMTLDLRAAIAGTREPDAASGLPALSVHAAVGGSTGTLFLPGRSLRQDGGRLGEIARTLGAQVPGDDGADITLAMETGAPVSRERMESFLAPLRAARRIVAGDGLLHRVLRRELPRVQVLGVGEALLSVPEVRAAIQATDLYMIETRGFHGDWKRLVTFYDALRVQTGCTMNLDLLRAAIPTGAAAAGEADRAVDGAAQAAWILEGRSPARIVVEDLADLAILAASTSVPVVHVSQLRAAP